MKRRFGAVFHRIFTWSIAGATIALGGFSLFILAMVFIVKNPAYQGQGLGITGGLGAIIIPPLGAIIGGSIRFILLNVS